MDDWPRCRARVAKGAVLSLALWASSARAQAQPSGTTWEDGPEPPARRAEAAPAPAAPLPSPSTTLSAPRSPDAPRASEPLDVDVEPFEYDPARGVPPGYHVVSRARRGFVIAGAIAFGVWYAFCVVAATVRESATVLAVPVIGPLIYLPRSDVHTNERPFWGALSVAQGVGATLFVVGLAARKRWVVRDRESRFYLGPTQVGTSGYGVGAWARF